jgi:hypothetical protein
MFKYTIGVEDPAARPPCRISESGQNIFSKKSPLFNFSRV